MSKFLKFTIALILGIVALGFQSCGLSGSKDSKDTEDTTQKEAPVWRYETLTDEFGDESGEKIIVGNFDGNFSNSATDNAEAKLQVLYSEPAPIFRVFDYGNQAVKGEYFMRFRVKEENGNVETLYMLNKNGFFMPINIPCTLGIAGIDSLIQTEQTLKFAGVLLDGSSDTSCLNAQFMYLKEAAGEADGYSDMIEANRPKYLFLVNSRGLKEMIDK